jgi:hypothetical protein
MGQIDGQLASNGVDEPLRELAAMAVREELALLEGVEGDLAGLFVVERSSRQP